MAGGHGPKRQKKLAKQKAKRNQRRQELASRTSLDPTVRLRSAASWPVLEAWMPKGLWKQGIGQMILARTATNGEIVFAVFLVDVYCLGIKDCFWETGSLDHYREIRAKIDKNDPIQPVSPACLVRVVEGARAYAESFGFSPHRDFRNLKPLLEGIDVETCAEVFSFGKDGKPFYVQGPYESNATASIIQARVTAAGGHYLRVLSPRALLEPIGMYDELEIPPDDELDGPFLDDEGDVENPPALEDHSETPEN